MKQLIYIIILFCVSLLSTWWIFRKVHRIAQMKNVVDNPDARKLQDHPVPVLGGLSVFFGIIVALVFCQVLFGSSSLFSFLGIMAIMLFVGTTDDVLSLSPFIRLVIEVIVVLLFIYGTGWSINDLHGLWGIDVVPSYVAVPLTVVACVGIINAVNMIDGVDGLMSGYGIVVSFIFGCFFYDSGDIDMAAMAMISAGAMIPFLLYNVVGQKSKMYLGDGGSLMIGTMMALFVIAILKENSLCSLNVDPAFGLVPFSLAVLSVPVFDTLRVMTIRIFNRRSPFRPDRNHLHHMFVDLGFSHFGTSVCVICLNLLVIFIWWLSYKAGASQGVQLLIVIAAGMMNTFGLYAAVEMLRRRGSRLYDALLSAGRKTHMENTGIWKNFRDMLDKRFNTNKNN